MKSFGAIFAAAAIALFLSCALAGAQPTNTISLVQGWNLVSLPLQQPANVSPASVLSSISGAYEVVWAYAGQSWKVYDPNDSGGSTLTTMQAGNGYWIKMTSAQTLSVSGSQPPASLSLLSGWNLVGYNGASCADAAMVPFSLTGGEFEVLWGYSFTGWQSYPANSGGLTQLCPGAGYWIDVSGVNGTATWTFSGWAWESGSSRIDQAGAYGTEHAGAPGNVPGARGQTLSWTDLQGNLWLFGGYGYDSAGKLDELNDLWKFDGTNWTWESGSSKIDQAGAYGTEYAGAPGNVPGARQSAVSWTDLEGNFWLFGGYGVDSVGNPGHLNDLWKFDGTNWSWESGSEANGQAGVYGTKGKAAAGNVPGARSDAVSWTDQQGSLWLFGGYGVDSAGNTGDLNDLWKFDGTNWTWVSGANNTSSVQPGVYGTKGKAAAGNTPGARSDAVSWTDQQGNLWLFGGAGYDSAGKTGYLNDLWKFDGTNWTWVSGGDKANQTGAYGAEGVVASGNVPGGRSDAVSWTDQQGNLWLFGGSGYSGDLNDLWKFDGTHWTWVSGSDTVDQAGAYGAEGIVASGNMPGARWGAVSWTDLQGNLRLFGGNGYDSAGATGFLNDMWLYEQ
jgi:N-acetylneuraminic acid mutarotase